MSHKKRTCKLTKRLAEDMLIRNMAEATIDAYTYQVRKFADFIENRSTRKPAKTHRKFEGRSVKVIEFLYSNFQLHPSNFQGFLSENVPRSCLPCSADKKSTS